MHMGMKSLTKRALSAIRSQTWGTHHRHLAYRSEPAFVLGKINHLLTFLDSERAHTVNHNSSRFHDFAGSFDELLLVTREVLHAFPRCKIVDFGPEPERTTGRVDQHSVRLQVGEIVRQISCVLYRKDGVIAAETGKGPPGLCNLLRVPVKPKDPPRIRGHLADVRELSTWRAVHVNDGFARFRAQYMHSYHRSQGLRIQEALRELRKLSDAGTVVPMMVYLNS